MKQKTIRDAHFQALEDMYLSAPINQFYCPRIAISKAQVEIEIDIEIEFEIEIEIEIDIEIYIEIEIAIEI